MGAVDKLLEQNFDQNTKKIIGDCFKSLSLNEIISSDVEKVKDENLYSETEQEKKCNKCLKNIFNQMEEEFFAEKLVKMFVNLFTQNESESVESNSSHVDENFISISMKKTIEKTPLEILKQNVDLTIDFMEKFSNHQQIQKKALLMLCNYRVLHSVSFDINKCVKLVVESLVNFEETDMNRMAIAICSILAHKLSNTEKSYLASNSFFINRLIDLIKIHFQYSLDQDIILNFIIILLKEINGYQSIESIYQNSKNDKIESFMSIYEKIMNKMEDMNKTGVFEKFSEGNENYNQEEIERNLLIIKEESLIMELLNENREDSTAVIKNLNRLYNYLLIHCEPRNDLIDLIISLMQKHSNSIDVIRSSTLCLYSLTRDKLAEKIEKNLIQNVFDATLSAMELYKDDQQLHTNGLSIFANEIILQDITFDKYKCVEIALNSLMNFEDKGIIQRAIGICSGLTTKLTLDEKLNLFSKSVYIETLINIVRISAHSPSDNEFVLYYTLSCLWNMTDRSPELCQIFLKKAGLNACLIILNVSLEYNLQLFLSQFFLFK
jgi:transcriptional regulator